MNRHVPQPTATLSVACWRGLLVFTMALESALTASSALGGQRCLPSGRLRLSVLGMVAGHIKHSLGWITNKIKHYGANVSLSWCQMALVARHHVMVEWEMFRKIILFNSISIEKETVIFVDYKVFYQLNSSPRLDSQNFSKISKIWFWLMFKIPNHSLKRRTLNQEICLN